MEQEAVLIVDDERLIRETLRFDLLEQGYAADVVASGEEAFAVLDRKYDLIITDLVMEGISGLEVLRRAKELEPDRAVFILTGHRELDAAIGALRLGADDYIIKPYAYDEMISRVKTCLQAETDRRASRRAKPPILTMCSHCKKIRSVSKDGTKTNEWVTIEHFFSRLLGTEVSHGLCPDCYEQKMMELTEMIRHGQFFDRS